MGKFVQDGTGIVVSVDDSKDDRFTNGGWTRDGEKPKPVKSATPDKSWTVAELTAYAGENDVDLSDATKKDDVLAAVELHLESLASN